MLEYDEWKHAQIMKCKRTKYNERQENTLMATSLSPLCTSLAFTTDEKTPLPKLA